MASVGRAPKTSRDSMSRPSVSVPNQCAAEGGSSRSPSDWAAGSASGSSGAPSATIAMKPTMTRPATPIGWLSSRRSSL
ncbi:hypothetical protein D3C71_2003510 [compost metagenome]